MRPIPSRGRATPLPRPTHEARALVQLALPLMLSQVAQVLTGMVDTVMAGHAGAQAQAVVALGVALWIPLYISLSNVVQAVSPIIAQHHGAGDAAAVARDAREGVWLAAWLAGVPLAALPFAEPALIACGIDPALAERTGVFLWGIGVGLPAALIYRALAFYSAAIGQTRPIMVLAFVGLGVNALLNPVLIYGRYGIPALGGAGCGWASAIGMWIALISLALWTAWAPAYRECRIWHGWRLPQAAAQWQLLRLGLPMGGAGLAEVTAFTGVTLLIARFGAEQIAAHQIGLNFSALTFMLPMGIATATAIRVGHALGAADPLLARRIAWTGMAVGLAIAAAVIVPIVLLRHQVAAFYSDDARVRIVSANLLLFAAFWQLFDAAQVVATGALRGYKVTLMPMLLMLGAFWIVGIPLGAWLGYRGWTGGEPLGVYGFWVGLVVGLVLVSIGLTLALRRVADAALGRSQNPGVLVTQLVPP